MDGPRGDEVGEEQDIVHHSLGGHDHYSSEPGGLGDREECPT